MFQKKISLAYYMKKLRDEYVNEKYNTEVFNMLMRNRDTGVSNMVMKKIAILRSLIYY